MQQETDWDALTVADHARRLGYSRRTVENRLAAGTWPAKVVRLGGKRLIPRQEHERILAEAMAAAGICAKAAPSPNPVQAPARAPGRPRRAGGRP